VFFIIENWFLVSVNTKDTIFGVGQQQLTPKMGHFCITQRVSDLLAGTKDRLPADTKNCFCSSACSEVMLMD
jgi:hypothetical protein